MKRLAGLLVMAAIAVLVGRTRPPDRPETPRTAPEAVAPAPPVAPATLDGRSEARLLRRRLMASDDELRDAVALLRDAGRDRRQRERIAVVLGSLPGLRGKRELFRALRDGSLGGLERAAVLALGAHSPEEEREFARDGMPYAVEAAEGLVVYVCRPVEDPDARLEILRRLSDGTDPAVRRASALVLRDSVAWPEVREGFLARLGTERDSEAAAEGAAALAQWARRAAPEDAERARIVGRITEVAPERDEVFRFRLLSPIGEAPMTPDETAGLRRLLDSPDPDVRGFGADLLGRRLESQPGRDPEAVPRLVRTLEADPDDAVRATSARALGCALGDAAARSALLRALSGDVEWPIRASAATALGAHPSTEVLDALRRAAAQDSSREVRLASSRALASN